MAEKELVFKVKVVNESGQVVEKTATSFKDLNQSVSTLKTELDKTDLGSEKFKELQKELKKSEGALEDARNKTTPLLQRLGEMPGVIGTAAQSVKGLGQSFQVLIANPIGALIAGLVAAFTLVTKAINSTEEGQFKFNQAISAFTGLLDPVIKLVGKLGVLLIDGVLAGINAVQKGLEALGFESFAEASKDAENLTESINKVEEAEGDLAVARAQQNKSLAEAREIIADTNVSLEDRKKALKEVKKSEEDLAQREVELAKQRLANTREQLRLRGASKEALDAEEAALIQLANTEQQQAAIRRKNIKAEQALERETEAQRKAAAEEEKKRREDRKRAAEEAFKFEQALDLQLIQDKFERDKAILEIEKKSQLDALKNLKVSREKRDELELQIQQVFQQKLTDLEAQKTKADEDKAKADADKAKADADKKLAAQKANLDAEIELAMMKDEKDLQLLQEKLTARLELELQNEELTEAQRTLIREKYAQQIVGIEKAVTDAKKDEVRKRIAEDIAEVQSAANTAGDLASIFGEETAAGKAAATAQALLNTYAGAAAALNDETIPNTFARIVAAVAIVAAGLRQVKQINATPTNIPKKAAGGFITGQGSSTSDNIPVMLSNGEFVMNAASTQMFAPVLESMNLLGQNLSTARGVNNASIDGAQRALISTLGSQNSSPIRAYVLSDEVSTQTAFDRKIQTRSTL
jgi:hypothetical protein